MVAYTYQQKLVLIQRWYVVHGFSPSCACTFERGSIAVETGFTKDAAHCFWQQFPAFAGASKGPVVDCEIKRTTQTRIHACAYFGFNGNHMNGFSSLTTNQPPVCICHVVGYSRRKTNSIAIFSTLLFSLAEVLLTGSYQGGCFWESSGYCIFLD